MDEDRNKDEEVEEIEEIGDDSSLELPIYAEPKSFKELDNMFTIRERVQCFGVDWRSVKKKTRAQFIRDVLCNYEKMFGHRPPVRYYGQRELWLFDEDTALKTLDLFIDHYFLQ